MSSQEHTKTEAATRAMSDIAGMVHVTQPGEAASYWQPMPANGFSEIRVSPDLAGFAAFSAGFQNIAPGGHVRAHAHDAQAELLVCFKGRGSVVADGETHRFEPGTSCLLGPLVQHEIINDGPDDLVMFWVISPPGLENFFAAIGQPRVAGEPAPAPFERPADIAAVEQEAGFLIPDRT